MQRAIDADEHSMGGCILSHSGLTQTRYCFLQVHEQPLLSQLGMTQTWYCFLQVHEKSILLALLPVTLLAFDQPVVAAWLPVWAAFSMYPLLKKDGLHIAYLACLLLWLAVAAPPSSLRSGQQSAVQTGHAYTQSTGSRRLCPRVAARFTGVSGQQLLHYASLLSLLPAASIHVGQCFVQPPARLMHLYDAAYVSLSFAHIFAIAVYLNISQWSLSSSFVSQTHSKRS